MIRWILDLRRYWRPKPEPVPDEHDVNISCGSLDFEGITIRTAPVWNSRAGRWENERFTRPNLDEPTAPTNPRFTFGADWVRRDQC